MRGLITMLTAVSVAAWWSSSIASEPQRKIPAAELRSGITFAGASVRAMQEDDLANPGMLWVERGGRLWQAAPPAAKPCSGCHGDAAASMKGVATRYPGVDGETGRLVTLEARINLCRTRHQSAPAFVLESDDLLGLSAYVAMQSRGMPVNVAVDERTAGAFERARSL